MLRHDPFRTATLRDLNAALRKLEGGGSGRRTPGAFSTGLPPLDSVLPDGGLCRGRLVEWLSAGSGTGLEQLALAAVPHALTPYGMCVLVDPRREFFPRGAAAAGLDLERLLIFRPSDLDDALWGTELALRCPAVDAVVAWDELVSRGRSHDRIFRRLQLAAEEGQTLGLFLRPAAVQRYPCWGDLRLLVQATQLTVLHCRSRMLRTTWRLERDDETGAVRLVTGLADSTPGTRATGA